MTDGRLVAPEIVPIDVAKSQPDSRMHGGMVGRILIVDRRMAAGDLTSARGMGMSEIRSFDGTVTANIVGNRRAVMSYHKSVVRTGEAESFACGPPQRGPGG